MIFGESEILKIKILHLDKTLPLHLIAFKILLITPANQKFVNNTSKLPALSTDHSLALILLSNDNSDKCGHVL